MVGATKKDEKPFQFDNFYCTDNEKYLTNNIKMNSIIQDRYKNIMELNQLIDYAVNFEDNNIENQINVMINNFLNNKIDYSVKQESQLKYTSDNNKNFEIKPITEKTFDSIDFKTLLKMDLRGTTDSFEKFKFTTVDNINGCVSFTKNEDEILDAFMKKPEDEEQFNEIKTAINGKKFELLQNLKMTKSLSTDKDMKTLKIFFAIFTLANQI
jgi:hypothetical protein